jgi:hypothetical protein
MEETPFERMKRFLEKEGYKLKHLTTEEGAEGYIYFPKNKDNKYDVAFYFGYPSGKEWYWYLDGKIAIDNSSCFDKWSRCPFYVWLPETDNEAERIIKALKYLCTKEGIEKSNHWENIQNMFGFEIPKREA